MTMRNPYEVLGLKKSASPAKVKSRYVELARSYHPDNGGNADLFIEITKAYTILINPATREKLDREGVFSDADASRDQKALLELLAMLLESTMADQFLAGKNPTEADIVMIMRSKCAAMVEEIEAKVRGAETRRAIYKKLIGRIKRKGEGHNKFAEVIDDVVAKETRDLPGLIYEMTIGHRAAEELQRYDSIVDVVRTVQAQHVVGQTGRIIFVDSSNSTSTKTY